MQCSVLHARPMTENTSNTRAGFAAIIGAPNAGKSTLVNRMVGAKVSIVTQKVQTTRFPVRGVALAAERRAEAHGEAEGGLDRARAEHPGRERVLRAREAERPADGRGHGAERHGRAAAELPVGAAAKGLQRARKVDGRRVLRAAGD